MLNKKAEHKFYLISDEWMNEDSMGCIYLYAVMYELTSWKSKINLMNEKIIFYFVTNVLKSYEKIPTDFCTQNLFHCNS